MQLTRKIIIVLAGLALTAGAQQPQQPPAAATAGARKTRVLTVEEAVQLALEHNLDIQITKYNPIKDQLTLNGSYSAYDPAFQIADTRSFAVSQARFSPVVNTNIPGREVTQDSFTTSLQGYTPVGLNYTLSAPVSRVSPRYSDASYGFSPNISLRQHLLKDFLTGITRYTISLNKNVLKSDELGLRLQIMSTVTSVKAAYFNLIFSRENVKVNAAALKLAEQLLSENRMRVQVGALAPLDEKQAESQAASSRADLLAAEQALAAQEDVLKSLITDQFSEWADVTPIPSEQLLAVPADLNLQESWRRGLEQRPEYLQQKLSVESQNITIKYSHNQLYPAVDVTGSYGYSPSDNSLSSVLGDAGAAKAPDYSVGLSVSFPLGNVAARSAYQSAKAGLKQLVLQLKKQEQTIIIQIDNDVKVVNSDYQRVKATQEAEQYAEAALDAERKKLENGKSTSFVVLQLQRDLTTARSTKIRALADYNIALEQLALDEGSTLERNRIEVKSNRK